MENTNFTMSQKMALAALAELNYLFYNYPCLDEAGNYLEPLDGKDWNPMFAEELTVYINNVYLKKYPNIVSIVQRAFDEAMAADNNTFFEAVEFQFGHHLHDGAMARQKIFHKAYLAGDKTSSKEELMRQDPHNCNDTWVENGNFITDSLLWRGLMDFGSAIPALREINDIMERATNMRAMYMGALAACPQTNIEAPESSTGTTTRLATDETENKRKRGEKPQPDFKTIIQPINGKTKEEILTRLHELIDGKKDSDVGVVILKAKQEKYITKNPNEEMMRKEFGDIGKWGSIRNYFNPNYQGAAAGAESIELF